MRKKWVKFKNLDKKDKIFRIINLILMLAFCLVCIALGIYNACIGDPRNRLFPALQSRLFHCYQL